MIDIDKLKFIIKFGTISEWYMILKERHKCKTQDEIDLMYLELLILPFTRMCIKKLTKSESCAWLDKIGQRLGKLVTVADFVDYIYELEGYNIFKDSKDKLDYYNFVMIYLEIYIRQYNKDELENFYKIKNSNLHY